MVREFQSVVTANQINFYDNYKAPLHAGSYRLVLQQSVTVGKEDYFVSSDGFLMPVRKGQPPPDLRYFTQDGK